MTTGDDYFFMCLNAVLGVHGVKTSRLQTNNDYWEVASLLWPSHVDRTPGATLADLYRQIKAMPKSDRRRGGTENAHRVPPGWFSGASFHQSKLTPTRLEQAEAAQ